MDRFISYMGILSLLLFCSHINGQITTGTSPIRYMKLEPPIPKPEKPAILQIENIQFSDQNGNRLINAQESCIISFNLINKGSGNAYAVQPSITDQNKTPDMSFDIPSKIQLLKPGESRLIKVRLHAGQNIRDGKADLRLSAYEGNGFNASVQHLVIDTKAFEAPQVIIADAKFTTDDGGIPTTGKVVTLQLLVQNLGQGEAQDVKVSFTLPENVFKGEELVFTFDKLKVGEAKMIQFPFFTNSRFTDKKLTIYTELSESMGMYAEKDRAFSLDMQRPANQTQAIEVKSYEHSSPIPVRASLHSDVDINIPESTLSQPHAFALIIGNENYEAGQKSDREINVPFAKNDALVFKEYAQKTLGIPFDNIILLTDASKVSIETNIDRLCKLAETYPGKQQPEIFFYYAGHGMYDSRKKSFIIPIDVTGTHVEKGIELDRLYRKLANTRAAKTTMFIDACFSGGSREGSLLAARGMKIEPNENIIDGNLVVFTAASGNQTAFPYKEKQHGIFTYFLLKKLQETQGYVNYGELSEYIRSEVEHQSIKINDARQTPSTLYGIHIDESWKSWKLK